MSTMLAIDRGILRLESIASDLEEAFAILEARGEAAREHGYPGPPPADIDAARQAARGARAEADAFRRRAFDRRPER